MLKAINTKILLGILAAVVAIGGELVHQHEETKRAADAAAKAAAILQQQQAETQAAKDREAALWKQVEANKKKQNSLNKIDSKTYTSYLP